VNPDARKRVEALREFAELGAGFQIAMRDLELRGAGNILGPEQSGHIAMVGYEMYCRLLEKAVKRLRHEEVREPVSVEIDLDLEAFIPDEAIPSAAERLDLYRRISREREPGGIAELAREIEDRYGEPPAAARRLLDLQELRALAARHGVVSISRDGEDRLVLRGTDAMKVILDGAGRRVRVIDPRTAVVDLPRARTPGPWRGGAMSDEEVFRIVLEWLRTGKLPEPPSPFKALRARAAR